MESLKLAPPPFPVQWPESPAQSSFRKAPGADWPGEAPTAPYSTAASVEWSLKTDREAYISSLESKLKRLAPASTSQRAADDSGYASSGRVLSPPQAPFEDPDEEDDELPEDAAYGDDAAEDDSEQREEGAGLLWGVETGSGGSSAISRIDECDEHLSEMDALGHTPLSSTTGSPVLAFLVPPTPRAPDAGDDDNAIENENADGNEPHVLEFRVPSDSYTDPRRRISFNSSVRISGGIGGRKSRASKVLAVDLFSPPPGSEKTRSPSTSSARSFPPNASSNSRPSSPNDAHSRTGSSGSLQQPFQLSGYSSTATSAVPSRSSSPCSSIYAPLQPPSATCPSPMLVRPPPKRAKGLSMSFAEYLRGRADDTEETAAHGYRDLVEAQRRKKTRFEQRRSPRGSGASRERSKLANGGDAEPTESLWDKIKQMLATGAAGAGSRGGRSFSHYGSLDTSTKRSRSSRALDDDDDEDEEEDRRLASRGRGRGRGGRIARKKPSTLSLSSVSDADDEGGGRDARSAVSDDDEGFYAGLPSMNRRIERPKTQADVMFGPAPTRWSRWDWWVWRIRGGIATVFGDCLGRGERVDDEERA
ncbi:hypothetical protein RQP46_000434 [Phenoliferia psychrophenolica]